MFKQVSFRYYKRMNFVLTLLGILLLLIFVAGIGLGVYMATNPNTRELGWLFAVWWVPGAAAAAGVLMKDLVTFTVGSVCFLVAGVVFLLKGLSMRRSHAKRGREPSERPEDPDTGSKGRRRTAS